MRRLFTGAFYPLVAAEARIALRAVPANPPVKFPLDTTGTLEVSFVAQTITGDGASVLNQLMARGVRM